MGRTTWVPVLMHMKGGGFRWRRKAEWLAEVIAFHGKLN